jgi:hypothetical protein
VAGASKGEGLGNKFLTNIRETDAVLYVLRVFSNDKIINTQNSIDPIRDKDILDTELILKDLEIVEKRVKGMEGDVRAGKKEAMKEFEALNKAKKFLEEGKILTEQEFTQEELKEMKSYQLLTLKPRLYLLNGKDEEVPPSIIEEFKSRNWPFLIIDMATEFEAAGFSLEERKELALPLETELDILIKKCYETLGLITFLTTGPDETRAWTIKKGAKAPQAGGAIHSDFERTFIRADAINWKDLIDAGGFAKAREKGMIRTEGKEYIVQDGDVIEIKHGA